MAMISCLYGKGSSGFSLNSLSCVVLAPSEYLHGSQPWSSPWVLIPEPEPWHSVSHLLLCAQACEPLLRWKCCSETNSVVNSLHFAFWEPSVVLLSEVLKFPPVLTCEGVSEFVKTFSFMTPSPECRSLSRNTFLFFYLHLLPYLILKRLTCIFGSLGSSASVLKVYCKSCFICK